jgi:hypothetical protein
MVVAGLELTSKTSCLYGYKQFTCRYNFPYCDSETGETFPSCPDECAYFHNECGLDSSTCNAKFYEFMDADSPSCEFAPVTEVAEEEEE